MSRNATVTGSSTVCKTLAKEFPRAELWIDRLDEHELTTSIANLLSTERAEIMKSLGEINAYMKYSMHPITYRFTVADLELWGAIKGNPQILADVSSGKLPEIERWYKSFIELQPLTKTIVEYVKEITAVYISLSLSF